MGSPSSRELKTFENNQQSSLLPYFKHLYLARMERMSHVWKPCNWNEFLVFQKQQPHQFLFHNLTTITMQYCNSIKYLFSPHMACLFSSLKAVNVYKCDGIEEVVSSIDDGDEGITKTNTTLFPHLETLKLQYLRNLKCIGGGGGRNKRWSNEICSNIATTTTALDDQLKVNVVSEEDVFEVDDDNLNVLFPTHVTYNFNHLHELQLTGLKRVEVVFEMGSPSSRDLKTSENKQQPSLLPYLNHLYLSDIERMSHVWKHYNCNEFLVLQKQQPHQSSFHNLAFIEMRACDSIKYLFSPHMACLFSSLIYVEIFKCDGIEEVVSSIDDGDEGMTKTNTTLFPHLEYIHLSNLKNLKRIGGGGGRNKGGSNEICSNITTTTNAIDDQLKLFEMDDALWSLCQYSRKITIWSCDTLSSLIPSYAIRQMQKLEELDLMNCKSMIEVFETQGMNNSGGSSTSIDEGSGGHDNTTLTIPRLKNITVIKLPNLKILTIGDCDLLEHIFTFSTLESLKQLKKLKIWNCNAMKVVVKEETGDQTSTSQEVVFPCLRSIELENLPNLMGFFLGKIDFKWPLLEKIVIRECPQMMAFTSGQSTSANIKNIETSLGKYSVECGLNLNTTVVLNQGFEFGTNEN